MNELEYPSQSGSTGAGKQTTSLFLALYLLVLAFFIVLVTISNLEEAKSKAVMESLTSTFASVLPANLDPTRFTADDGSFLAGEAFLEVVSDIFSTDIQVARIEIVKPGEAMLVTIPSDSLFFSDSAHIREGQLPLLDRIVAALSAGSPELSFEMEFMIGIPAAMGGGYPVGKTLEKQRAGVFARTMRTRGAPPRSVVIGLQTEEEKKIVMHFFVRPMDQEALPIGTTAESSRGARP
jgi:hypothetical protein